MPEAVISDTSCLIVLSNIGEFNLLQKVYKKITITTEVANEFGEKLPEWINITSPSDIHRQQVLELQVDKGESSAIALALEKPGSTIILDDYKARRVAEQLGLKVTGTVGIIVKAKLRGIIPSVKPYLKKIRTTDFRLSHELEKLALKEAGEESDI